MCLLEPTALITNSFARNDTEDSQKKKQSGSWVDQNLFSLTNFTNLT